MSPNATVHFDRRRTWIGFRPASSFSTVAVVAPVLTAPSDEQRRILADSFDVGLQLVLDGIELYVREARAR